MIKLNHTLTINRIYQGSILRDSTLFGYTIFYFKINNFNHFFYKIGNKKNYYFINNVPQHNP